MFEAKNYEGAEWPVFVAEADGGFWVWCPEEKRLQLHGSEQEFEDEGDRPMLDLVGITDLDVATVLVGLY